MHAMHGRRSHSSRLCYTTANASKLGAGAIMGRGVGAGESGWLLDALTAMLRCHTVRALCDLAYDVLRGGLGYDRVGLLLIDEGRRTLVARRGTGPDGTKYLDPVREWPLHGGSYYARMLAEPRLQGTGPGYIYFGDVPSQMPPDGRRYLDGHPTQLLLASLRTRDRVTGLLSVDNLTTGRSLSAEDAPPLVGFATALAIALENVALQERLAGQIRSLDAEAVRSAGELSLIGEISRSLGGAQSLEAALDIVYEGIRGGLGYDRVGIHLVDPRSELLTEVRGTDAAGRKLSATGRSLSLAPDSSIWQAPSNALLLRGGLSYYTEDVYAETPPEQRDSLDGTPRQNLTVALRNGEVVTGLIAVDNLVSGRPIAAADAGPLLALAAQVGTAIERARLQERERIERQRLEILAQSARSLNSSLDRGAILADLAERLHQTTSAARVVFTQVDPASNRVESLVSPSAGQRSPASSGTPGADAHPALAEVLLTRRPFSGQLHDPSGRVLQPEEHRYLERRGLRAELLLPVVTREALIGVLEVYWTGLVTIDADTVAWCETIAGQAGVALHNARLYAEVAQRAERDGLTNLLNHRALLEAIDAAIAGGEPFVLLLLDLDKFKGLNDTHGHRAGDLVLLRVATLLQSLCGEGETAGRYGGDEFVLLLRRDDADAAAVAHELAVALTVEPYRTPLGLPVPLGISVGRARCPQDGRSRHELLDRADHRMYAAKRGVPSPAGLRA